MSATQRSHDFSAPTARIQFSTTRGQHAGQPPTLLTALGSAYNQGLDAGVGSQTPLSTTSLSSPFSIHQTSAYPPSPGAAMRGTSPLAVRGPSNFNPPYNPQQWGPLGSSSNSPLEAATRSRQLGQSARVPRFAARPAGPDEPVASPPPPYSPRREGDSARSPRNIQEISPSDTVSPATDPSQYGTPISAATTMSPDFTSGHHDSPSSCTPHIEFSSARSTASFPPPPVTSASSRARSNSRINTDRLLSALGSRAKAANVSSPVNAIEALQESTAHALAQAPEASYPGSSSRPPASRRAASTGGIGLSGQSSRTASPSANNKSRWEPGMPLPPPPPGPPPPSAARSQSLNRSSESLSTDPASISIVRNRRPPGSGTALAPVPPTPADWRDDSSSVPVKIWQGQSHGHTPLHIDTRNITQGNESEAQQPSATVLSDPQSSRLRRDSSCGGLARSPAVRNRSAKGIRERRSESRSGRGKIGEDSAIVQSNTITISPHSFDNIKPTDLILPLGGNSLSRRRTVGRSSPRDGTSMLSFDETLTNPPAHMPSDQVAASESSSTTPQPESDFARKMPKNSNPTPPFSPGRRTFSVTPKTQTSPSLPPKSLPTPPPQQPVQPRVSSSLSVPPAPDERPISHLLHIPNSDDSFQPPLVPSSNKSQHSSADVLGPESPQAFATRAIERHRIFAEREAAAVDNSERLEIFAQFILAESRIRREKYAAVFEDEDVSIPDLVQGMFASSAEVRDHNQLGEMEPTKDSRASSMSASADSNWHQDSSAASRARESPISISTECSSQNRPESSWWNDYVPCLSPIASMSVVTGQDHDEMGSRGRASSRWWEDKSCESAQEDAFSVLKKSKRESKYMGLPKEARSSPALFESGPSATRKLSPANEHDTMMGQAIYSKSEYPLEKVGWHEESSSPLPPPPAQPPTPQSVPYTMDPKKLDISRFVTLPPPYPRHHPAVNNNHPDLAEIRTVVRSLHETEEVDAIRGIYSAKVYEQRQRADSWCKHQRSLHDQEMQFRMDHGEISQEEFDQAESEVELKIQKAEKEVIQTDFDLFQRTVLSPLHSLFSERIAKATTTMQELSSRLFTDAQKHSPNAPQEEGDEQPELLEKLTQLKWLFEAREILHRKIYDLLSERNDKYKAIVLLPYRQSENHNKCAEAESFFVSDTQERRAGFENEVSSRFDAFLTVVEANVVRGVEIQLSAFWDIAPPLHRVLSRVPNDLQGFEIQIPPDEYLENPSYHTHPLQYLYSLLEHAQKSTYQFIESQINLLCLLHEIKSGALNARSKAEEIMGESWAAEENERREEARLTGDLKEKVGVIEGQWDDALGEELMSVRERVRYWLLERGGWDEDFHENS